MEKVQGGEPCDENIKGQELTFKFIRNQTSFCFGLLVWKHFDDTHTHTHSKLTLGCGALAVHCPAASSPTSRCSFSERHESSRRSRCDAETRYHPEERKQKTELEFGLAFVRLKKRLQATELDWSAFTLNDQWNESVSINWPHSTQQSRRPRSLPADPRARWVPPCCVACRLLHFLHPSAAPPPYSD